MKRREKGLQQNKCPYLDLNKECFDTFILLEIVSIVCLRFDDVT